MIKVKQLEWAEVGHNTMGAKTPMGVYLADSRGHWWWNNKWRGRCDTPEEARAACQADYEKRILSALEPSHTDELVKAAGEAATQLESAAFEFELEALPDATRCRLIANTLRQALAKSPNPPEMK